MRGAIPPLPNRPSRRGAHLKHRNNFTFTWDPPTTYNICVSIRLLPEIHQLLIISMLAPGYFLRSANYPTNYNIYVCTRLLSEIHQLLTISMLVPGYYLRSASYLTISTLVSGYWDPPTTYNFSASAWLQLDSRILSWDQVFTLIFRAIKTTHRQCYTLIRTEISLTAARV
jgi:hypothetical protein